MTELGAYTLLDCGDGRRLDRFGDLRFDRPAPTAGLPRRNPGAWAGALAYRAGLGWRGPDGPPADDAGARISIAGVSMEVRPAASGNVGLFPEHALNADWLTAAMALRARRDGRRPAVVRTSVAAEHPAPSGPPEPSEAPEILNLFAYTGLMTLVAARAGARVVHVDASRPSTAWARRNAELSGLGDRPIRWLVDDALAFVRREARRGRRYDGIILDPPSYGHGADGAGTWRFDERIGELLDACAGITAPDALWLLTTHTPGWDVELVAGILAAATDAGRDEIEGIDLRLTAESGAILRLGAAARLDPLRADRR